MRRFRWLTRVPGDRATSRRWSLGGGAITHAVPACLSMMCFCGCRQADDSATSSAPAARPVVWFRESSASAGLDFTHQFATQKRFYLPESMSGGVGLLDYDGDGHLDVYFVQGGELEPGLPNPHGNQMFRNRGDGSFEDVTDSTGTGDTGYGMGCACGDYDGDGDVDLYVTNVGPNVLYRNNGDGTFTDVTVTAGVGDASWGASAAFADYDGDGRLDLFVVNYLDWSADREQVCVAPFNKKRDYCGPTTYGAPARDTLYQNQGNGSFVEVTERAGLSEVRGNGLGLAAGDFDQNGLLDFYVANDQMANRLWLSTGDGRFEESALFSGCALNQSGSAEAGMGVMAIDADSDGDLDLCMTHLHNESHTFYRNERGIFTDVTALVGLAAPSLPFTGFGMALVDLNQDTHLDLLVANGRVHLTEPVFDRGNPYAEPYQLFRGQPDGRFVEDPWPGDEDTPLLAASRGAAFGDLDNDGDIDVVVVNYGARAHLLKNEIGSTVGGWAMFRILNSIGGYALGAGLQIRAGGITQRRHVQRAYSYCSSNDPRVHFGLGHAISVEEVMVRWPDGTEERFGPFEANRIIELRRKADRKSELD